MTNKEIMAMRGTEFIYKFMDGKTMKAYVKQIDLKNNLMTCWSYSLETDCGTNKFAPLNEDEEKEQACCVIGAATRKEIIEYLTDIKTGLFETRKYLAGRGYGIFTGCPL